MKKEEIFSICKKTISSTDIQVGLRWDSEIGIFYNFEENKILINQEAFLNLYHEIISLHTVDLSLENLIKIMIYHELGHKRDSELINSVEKLDQMMDALKLYFNQKKINEFQKLAISYLKLKISIELKAWDYSLSFLPRDINKEHYKIIREHCIHSYISLYKQLFLDKLKEIARL